MSTTTNDARGADLGLSRSESWVLHHILTDRIDAAIEDGERPPWWALEVAAKLESTGTISASAHQRTDRLTCFEAWRVRRALAEYAADESTPNRDAAAAWAIVDRLDASFESPPKVIG